MTFARGALSIAERRHYAHTSGRRFAPANGVSLLCWQTSRSWMT